MWHISECKPFLTSWLAAALQVYEEETKESEIQEESSHHLITPERRRGCHNTQEDTEGDEQKYTEQAGGVFGQCLTFCGEKQQTSHVSISL